MRETTLLDLYKEMGASGHVLLMLFLAILAFGGMIHFRALDHRWRRAFLLLCGVQGATGLLCGVWSIFVVVNRGRRAYHATLEGLLVYLGENMVVIQFGAWLTVVLLLVSAALFVTSNTISHKLCDFSVAFWQDAAWLDANSNSGCLKWPPSSTPGITPNAILGKRTACCC